MKEFKKKHFPEQSKNKTIKTVYKCPRCDYSCTLKKHIKQHFNRKEPCSNKNNVHLTEDIKKKVYEDGIIHPQNNLERKVDDSISDNNIDQYNPLSIGPVNDINFNVIFEKIIKRSRFNNGKSWQLFLEDVGAKEIINLIKNNFLNTYEVYLIKHLHHKDSAHLNRIKIQEYLEMYYRFISVFDLLPHIVDNSDAEILGHQLIKGNDYYLADKYMDTYYEQKVQLRPSEKNSIKRKIIMNIIKRNSILEFNKTILEILKIDGETLVKSREIENGGAEEDGLLEFGQ